MSTAEVDKLKEEIENLKKDLKEMSGAIKNLAASTLDEEKSKLFEEFSLDEIKNKINSIKDKGVKELDDVEKSIAKNPLRSVAITFGVGFLAAFLLSKK